MLWDSAEIRGSVIRASDGEIGHVDDFLFQDLTWRVRWLVVDTGNWLTGRKLLLHPSSLGRPDADLREFPVALTRRQVEESPEIGTDQPVSRQMEMHLYDYYGWDPSWADHFFPNGAMASPFIPPLYVASAPDPVVPGTAPVPTGDPHLRSAESLTGYLIAARDGEIGDIRTFLIEDGSWGIRYLVVDTGRWLPGRRVLIVPSAVRGFDWAQKLVHLDLTCAQIKESPAYDPATPLDRDYETLLHRHYEWPGYWL